MAVSIYSFNNDTSERTGPPCWWDVVVEKEDDESRQTMDVDDVSSQVLRPRPNAAATYRDNK